MRIWLDDERDAPHYDREGNPQRWDVICRTAEAAIDLVRAGHVTFVDFDHDLGPGASGYVLAMEIERLAALDAIPPIDYAIHSGNPVGASRIDAAMKIAQTQWKEHGYYS